MAHCCKCCAELNDDVWTLYKYDDSLYCQECLIEQLIDNSIIETITEESEE